MLYVKLFKAISSTTVFRVVTQNKLFQIRHYYYCSKLKLITNTYMHIIFRSIVEYAQSSSGIH